MHSNHSELAKARADGERAYKLVAKERDDPVSFTNRHRFRARVSARGRRRDGT